MLDINFTEFPVLETERLLLRQFAIDDAEDFFVMRTHEYVMRYIDKKKMERVEEARDLINLILTAFKNNDGITWVISLKGKNKIIGQIGYWRMDKENHRAEIGYSLHPDFWGKGIMTEAINKIIDYGFNEMKLHSIEAKLNPGNAPSIKLLEKSNFKREGYFKEDYFFDGKFLDTLVYSLVNS